MVKMRGGATDGNKGIRPGGSFGDLCRGRDRADRILAQLARRQPYRGTTAESRYVAASNCGEAEAAESRKDFLHKMGICLKELRESRIWLRIIARKKMLGEAELAPVLAETEELIRIFKASIATAKRNGGKGSE